MSDLWIQHKQRKNSSHTFLTAESEFGCNSLPWPQEPTCLYWRKIHEQGGETACYHGYHALHMRCCTARLALVWHGDQFYTDRTCNSKTHKLTCVQLACREVLLLQNTEYSIWLFAWFGGRLIDQLVKCHITGCLPKYASLLAQLGPLLNWNADESLW